MERILGSELKVDADDAAEAAGSRYDVRSLGERLRTMRQQKGLSISQLAAASGVPGSTISKIENGQLKPSLVHAINLATALEENLGFLVNRYRRRPSMRAVVRAGERDEIDYPEMGLCLADLTGNFVKGVLETRLGRLSQGANSGEEPMRHPGEELCHVLDGSLRYYIGSAEWLLGPGDSVHFCSQLPHRWENASRGVTLVVWSFSDGLSF